MTLTEILISYFLTLKLTLILLSRYVFHISCNYHSYQAVCDAVTRSKRSRCHSKSFLITYTVSKTKGEIYRTRSPRFHTAYRGYHIRKYIHLGSAGINTNLYLSSFRSRLMPAIHRRTRRCSLISRH